MIETTNQTTTQQSEDDSEAEVAKQAVFEEIPGRRTTRGARHKAEHQKEQERNKSRNAQMSQNQQDRITRKAEEGLRNLAYLHGEVVEKEEETTELVNAYESPSKYPAHLLTSKIYTDTATECVLLPIGTTHVPFHISTIKAVSKVDEDQIGFLRFNFNVPSAKGNMVKDIHPAMKVSFGFLVFVFYIFTLDI